MSTTNSAGQSSLVFSSPEPPVPASSTPVEVDGADTRRHQVQTEVEVGSAVAAKILPRAYHLCGLEDIVFMASEAIDEAINENDGSTLPLLSHGLTPFHSL